MSATEGEDSTGASESESPGADEGEGTGGESYCGDVVCGPSENCLNCEVDCGVCEPCGQAPICEGAVIPGVIETHMDSLDIGAPPMGEDTASPASSTAAAVLTMAVDQDDPNLRVIVAALTPPYPGQPPQVEQLRAVFEQHPMQAQRVRKALAQIGLEPLEDYRDTHPPTPRAADLADPERPAAAGTCGPPQLRMRVSQVTVHDPETLLGKDRIYCLVAAEAMSGAELRVMAPTPGLGAGETHALALSEGVFWGQDESVKFPEGNLILTYNCIEQDSTAEYEAFLESLGEAAAGLGGIPGKAGWIFTGVGGVATLLGSALAFEGDDHLMNAQQIISTDSMMEMTHGVWWTVRKSEQLVWPNRFDWELRIEAWGCAETVPPPAG